MTEEIHIYRYDYKIYNCMYNFPLHVCTCYVQNLQLKLKTNNFFLSEQNINYLGLLSVFYW